jgi:hypothetical protein
VVLWQWLGIRDDFTNWFVQNAACDFLHFGFEPSVADTRFYTLGELADALMSDPPRGRCPKPAPP